MHTNYLCCLVYVLSLFAPLKKNCAILIHKRLKLIVLQIFKLSQPPRDFSNESPDIIDLQSDSVSRNQVKDVLQPSNCTEENKLTSAGTIKPEFPTCLRNRKQRERVKSSNLTAKCKALYVAITRGKTIHR